MSESEYKVEGFVFSDINEYNEAKQEAESVNYIRANNDLNDYNKVVKLYYKLVEQNNYKTLIGFMFLKELQKKVIEEGIISRDTVPGIKADTYSKRSRMLFAKQQGNNGQGNEENYRIKLRNSRIITMFLIGIILIMMIIAVVSDRSVYRNYENKLLNKYSAWEEDLNTREKALQEKEELQTVD